MLGKDEKGIRHIRRESSYGSLCSGIRSLGDVMWIHLALNGSQLQDVVVMGHGPQDEHHEWLS